MLSKVFKIMIWHIFLELCIIWHVGCEVDNRYDNYTLVNLVPADEDQIHATKLLDHPDVEILKESRGLNDSMDMLVPADKVEDIRRYARNAGIRFQVKREHYGSMFEEPPGLARRRVLQDFNVYGYNSYNSIQEYMESVAQRHPGLVSLESLGNSYEGRRMKLVKISTDPNAGRPIIFVDAGIHAREWVAPAMALYLIHRLTSDPDSRRDFNGVDWYILPMVNPDGYEYTRSGKSHRLWRKTRSRNTESNCFGVDGNRNYGFKWGVSGVSKNPCDKETYAGPRAFSEPETKIVRDIMMRNRQNIKLYVSLHSYGNYLVYPWGYTGEILPRSWRRLDRLAKKVSDSIVRVGGDPLKVMSAGRWYAAAGGSDDFAFGAAGIPYSYTMELTDGYEFIFPDYLLRQVLPQFYEGFKTFAMEIRNEFRSSSRRNAT